MGPSCALPKAKANPIDWPKFKFFPSNFGVPKEDPVIVQIEPSVALKGSFFGRRKRELKVPMVPHESGVLGGTLDFAQVSYIRQAMIVAGPGEAVDTQCGFIISPDGNSVSQLFTPGQPSQEIQQAWGLICTSYLGY